MPDENLLKERKSDSNYQEMEMVPVGKIEDMSSKIESRGDQMRSYRDDKEN